MKKPLVQFSEVAQLIVDNHAGIYTYQYFAQRISFESVCNQTKKDWDILLAGPNHEDHYLVVDSIFEGIEWVGNDGIKYMVHENDGDIWAIPEKDYNSIDWDALQS